MEKYEQITAEELEIVTRQIKKFTALINGHRKLLEAIGRL